MDEPKSHWIPREKPGNIPAKGLAPKTVAAKLQGICAKRAAAAHAKLSRPSLSLNDIYALYWAKNPIQDNAGIDGPGAVDIEGLHKQARAGRKGAGGGGGRGPRPPPDFLTLSPLCLFQISLI